MGIADLWPLVTSDPRVPFPVFLSTFIDKNARPPRLAIDAYMFMFFSQLPDTDPEDKEMWNRTIRNFMAKLWYFVQHNVLFVVVFDGKYKPGKLRNGHIPEVPGLLSYDEVVAYFRNISPDKYREGLGLVERLKAILQKNGMDYVQAPAEAEAECAWLQRLGVVDYVVSDDSDTLVFGASRMLRSFNRVKFMKEKEPVLSSTDYYCTPVHMENVTKLTGLDKNRLVLIAVLRGGDYSSGTEGIGITRAKEIALCGTTMLLSLPRKGLQDFGSLPDLTKMFVDTFVDQKPLLADPWQGLKLELDRAENLAAFNAYLDQYLKLQPRDVFGRNTTLKNVKVDEYHALLYFFPLVNVKIFKFMPFSVSFGQLGAPEADLLLQVDCSVDRFNYLCMPTCIGKLVIENGAQHYSGRGRGLELRKDKYALPRYRRFNLKALVVKLLADPKNREHIIFARTKESEGVTYAVLKFQRTKLHDVVYLVGQKDENPDPELDAENPKDDPNDPDTLVRDEIEEDEKTVSFSVPLNVLQLVAAAYVEEFEKRPKRKSSKKKPPPQRTTLDKIWGLSPTKEIEGLKDSPVRVRSPLPSPIRFPPKLKTSPTKLKSSPTKVKTSRTKLITSATKLGPSPNEPDSPLKESPRRGRRSRRTLEPGQSMVTSFFQQTPLPAPIVQDNPFSDTLFVPSDDEDKKTILPSSDDEYMRMKNIISGGPLLLKKAPVDSRLSSPELSPSKRKRMAFSPNNSPVKPRGEKTPEFPPFE